MKNQRSNATVRERLRCPRETTTAISRAASPRRPHPNSCRAAPPPAKGPDSPLQVLPCSCRPEGKEKSQRDVSYVSFPFFSLNKKILSE